MKKEIIIISGPNGSGKTTFARRIFPSFVKEELFLNVDIIAQALSPDHNGKSDMASGKIFLEKLDKCLEKDQSFIIETTLSGKLLLKRIADMQCKGFSVTLIFLWISSVELCDFRVKSRVAAGGHNIPYTIIERRYKRGLLLLPYFLEKVDSFHIYSANEYPHLITSKITQQNPVIHNEKLFSAFNQSIHGDTL